MTKEIAEKHKMGIRAFRRMNAIKSHTHKCMKCHTEWTCNRPLMDDEAKEVCSLSNNYDSICDSCLRTI